MALEATLPLCIRQLHHDELSYLPTATFLLGGHFPSICQRNVWVPHSCQVLCVHTQVGHSLASVCTPGLAERAGSQRRSALNVCRNGISGPDSHASSLQPRLFTFVNHIPILGPWVLYSMLARVLRLKDLPVFFFQNGKIEEYLQILSADVKDFREGVVLQTVETTWQSPLVFFFKPPLTFFLSPINDLPIHLFFPRGPFPPPNNIRLVLCFKISISW